MAFDIFDGEPTDGKELYDKLGRNKRHLFRKLSPLLERIQRTYRGNPIAIPTHNGKSPISTTERHIKTLQRLEVITATERRRGRLTKYEVDASKLELLLAYGKNPEREDRKKTESKRREESARHFLRYLFARLDASSLSDQYTHDNLLFAIAPHYRKLYLHELTAHKREVQLLEQNPHAPQPKTLN